MTPTEHILNRLVELSQEIERLTAKEREKDSGIGSLLAQINSLEEENESLRREVGEYRSMRQSQTPRSMGEYRELLDDGIELLNDIINNMDCGFTSLQWRSSVEEWISRAKRVL